LAHGVSLAVELPLQTQDLVWGQRGHRAAAAEVRPRELNGHYVRRDALDDGAGVLAVFLALATHVLLVDGLILAGLNLELELAFFTEVAGNVEGDARVI